MRYDRDSGRVIMSAGELCAAACASREPQVPYERARALREYAASLNFPGGTYVPVACIYTDTETGTECLITAEADAIEEAPARGLAPTLVRFRSVTPSALRTSAANATNTELLIAAWIVAVNRGVSTVKTRVTAAAEDGSGGFTVKSTERTHRTADLETTLRGLFPAVRRKALNEAGRCTELLPLLSTLPFPHPSLRAGQRDLILSVCSACLKGQRLFAQAPTGIGKTVSVLYGAVRAMSRGSIRRIFYLTAKASTRREAFAAASRIFGACAPDSSAAAECPGKAPGLRTVVLNAKDQLCPYSAAARKNGLQFVCDPEKCPLMKDYGARRPRIIDALLDAYHGFPVTTVQKAAADAGVCPYELSLDLSEFCDIIICDYNYVFDPAVKLRRYFGPDVPPEEQGSCVFLIDEAHNLTERARDIYSAVITQDDIEGIRPFCEYDSRLASAVLALDKALADCLPLCRDTLIADNDGLRSGYYFSRDTLEPLCAAAAELYEASHLFYVTHKTDPEAASAAASLCRLCRKWNDAAACCDERYRTYVEVLKERVSARLYCLDPSGRLDECLDAARASVFFSATLTPSDYFADVLGGGRDFRSLSLPSPFPRENLFIAAVTCVSTRWEDREKSARRIAAVIAASAASKPGNYIVYFPSYGYMETVLGVFRAKYPKVNIAVQRRGMTRQERDDFLAFFREDEGRLRVGFCVLGGSFSEGVDLPGSRLIGAVVVGVGLPGLSADRNIIRDYYENRIERGYDYAYTYPGMNNVLQAAGRVIRRDGDRGTVILVDDRYAEPRYRELMPPHWSGIKMISDLSSLPAELDKFWN